MTLFFALCFVGVAVAGFSAFVIFWPLTLVHVRDRHPALAARFGSGAFLKPDALAWLLRRDYRQQPDRSLSGLATPGWAIAADPAGRTGHGRPALAGLALVIRS
jgi:hypothetical protein